MKTVPPPLLEALIALRPNTIYTMAPPRAIVLASTYFSQDPVAKFRWGRSGVLLEAVMSDAASTVKFTCESEKLRGVCSCSIRPTECRHVLAAAMTIVRVLHGARFHSIDLPPRRIEALREQLRAPAPVVPGQQVILSSSAPGGRFALDYDSGAKGPSWISTGPPGGMEWLAWQDRQPEKVASAFGKWLATKPAAIGITVRSSDAEWSFPEAAWLEMRARTELQADGTEVVIRRCVLDEEGRPIEPFIDVGYGLVVLVEQRAFAEVKPSDAWQAFARICRTHAHTFTVDGAAFNSRPPREQDGSFTLLDKRGQPVGAAESECRGLLIATTTGNIVRVRVRAIDRDGREAPAHLALAAQFQELFSDGPHALLVKSPGRRRRLAELLGLLVASGSEKEIECLLEQASHDQAFTSFSMHGEDATKCLRHLLAQIRRIDEKLLLVDPERPDNPWLCCRRAGSALIGALAAFRRVFPDEDALRSKDLSFALNSQHFFRELPMLVEECAKQGVHLKLNENAVRTGKLEISVRAAQTGAIDWFELHPEARAGAMTIPRQQWDQILRTGHYRSEDHCLVALDDASLKLLGRLSAMLDAGKSGFPRLPRLRLFELLALRREGVACEIPPEDQAILESLIHLDRLPGIPLPANLRAELRDYQRQGYEWLAFLYRHRFGACLADDMGLGKTIQAIALLASLKEGIIPSQAPGAPHLLVVPPTLLFNWQNEIERFAPLLRVHEYTGARRSTDFSGADVVMTTYELARRDAEALEATPFNVAIFDEAQAVKNSAAARAQALARVSARFRICLTGTPLENHIGEFHSIMETAVPGLFGDRQNFLRHHEAGLPILDRARPFLLRRTKEKILAELPPKIESDLYFPLSERQKECYTRAVGEVRDEVLAAYDDGPAQQAGIMALAALMRLRQICIAPAMISDELDAGSPKLDYLIEQLTEVAEEGHSALVFSQFLKALDLTAAALDRVGLSHLRMDGSTPPQRRKELVESFQAGEPPGIFLISIKTGGAGLNLTRASYVYHLDPWWNPAVERQAADRTHRLGQTNSVYVQRLLMRHTVEEKMMALKQRKDALFAAVVGDGAPSAGAASLTADDFRFLIE